MRQYGNIDPWISAAFVGMIGFIGGLICMAFSTGVALASRKSKLLACALAPFLWTVLEFFRTNIPIIGSSWDLSGYPAARSLALLQITSVTGIYGLCFLIAAFGSLVAHAVLVKTRGAWSTVATATILLLLVALVGPHLIPTASPHYVAHLVQTNFPQSESYPPDWLQVHAGELDQLEHISVDAAHQIPGIIIWPEVPAPFSFLEQPFAERAQRIAQTSGNYFLVGVVDWKRNPEGKWLASNSAVLLNPQGQRIFGYDKIHLLPFGEYVPLRGWLTFAKRLTADISDFTPGSTYGVAQVPQGKFGTFICYEAIFPGEIRTFANDGAQLFVNISNDGWFGHSAAAEQHLRMARVRAAENRRWIIRSTNNGYTASIDPYGRIYRPLPPDIRAAANLPYDFRTEKTVYTRFGDWFAWLCVLVSVMLFLWTLMTRDGAGENIAIPVVEPPVVVLEPPMATA